MLLMPPRLRYPKRIMTPSGSFLVRNEIDVGTVMGIQSRGIYNNLKLRKSDTVLDCGANIGSFTGYASRLSKKVIAVEPDDSNFEYLMKNITENGYGNIMPLKYALSDFDGEGYLTGTNDVTQLSSIPTKRNVSVRRIDTLLSELKITKVDAMKVDVEGQEARLLRGQQFLANVREIIIETHGRENFLDCYDILETNGFEIVTVSAIRKFLNHLKNVRQLGVEYILLSWRTGFMDLKVYANLIPSTFRFFGEGRQDRSLREIQILYAVKGDSK